MHRYRDVAELGYDHTRDIRYTVKRDGEILDLVVRPTFVEFIDVDGIRRADPRLGVQWRHKPTGLKIIHRINGVDTKDNIDKARDLIKHNFGRDVVVGIDSNDNKIHDYKVHLHETSNLNIDDPKHEDHELVFFGRTRDDFYLQTGFAQNVHEALVMNGDLIRKFAGLPFQLLPIDRYILSPDSAVYGDETWFVNKLYSLIYIASITSILLALFNLLPLPRLDGSLLIFYGIEALTGKTLSRRKKALTLALSFFVFYCAVLLSNLDNAPGYIDSRMKKIQKFMDTKSEEQE